MTRLRFYDILNPTLAEATGCCVEDIPRNAVEVNRAQSRLLYDESGNEQGWAQTYAEMVFSVNRKNPVITCPRGVASLLATEVCDRAVPLRNQFFEYLEFGDGRMPKTNKWSEQVGYWRERSAFTRNKGCTFEDISNPPQQVQIFSNPADCVPNPITGAIPRVFIQGVAGNRIVVSQDNGNTVQGEFVTLAQPYAMSVNVFDTWTGFQKDVTQDQVQIFQSDPIWGFVTQILTMEPTELTAWYPRYYLHNLPARCCPTVRPIMMNPGFPTCGCPYPLPEYVQVTALARLDLIPVVAPTDYLLIQNAEAIYAECQAGRMSTIDGSAAKQEASILHAQAVRILRGQSIVEEGKNNVSVSFAPYGRHRNRSYLAMR
jgi:hypothetical protein